MFVLSLTANSYFSYFAPYMFGSWYLTVPDRKQVVLSKLTALKYLRRNTVIMIGVSVFVFIYTMAKCVSRLVVTPPRDELHGNSSMLFFWIAVGGDAIFTTLEIFLCSKLIKSTLKSTNEFSGAHWTGDENGVKTVVREAWSMLVVQTAK